MIILPSRISWLLYGYFGRQLCTKYPEHQILINRTCGCCVGVYTHVIMVFIYTYTVNLSTSLIIETSYIISPTSASCMLLLNYQTSLIYSKWGQRTKVNVPIQNGRNPHQRSNATNHYSFNPVYFRGCKINIMHL